MGKSALWLRSEAFTFYPRVFPFAFFVFFALPPSIREDRATNRISEGERSLQHVGAL